METPELAALIRIWSDLCSGVPCARMRVWIRVGGWNGRPAGEDNYALMDVHVNCRKVTSETMKEARRTDLMDGSERVAETRWRF